MDNIAFKPYGVVAKCEGKMIRRSAFVNLKVLFYQATYFDKLLINPYWNDGDGIFLHVLDKNQEINNVTIKFCDYMDGKDIADFSSGLLISKSLLY